ncbi:MAG: S9 family peptidase [Phycisphaerales bacterium]
MGTRGVAAIVGALMATGLTSIPGAAQEPYRKPPAGIVKILETPPTPAVSLNPSRTTMVLVARENLPPVADLARPMLRLAGSRIDPGNNGPHGPRRLIGMSIKRVADGVSRREVTVELPADCDVSMPNWSPDGSRFAFTNTKADGIELWVCDAATGKARALTGPTLNAVGGPTFRWMPDGRRLLCRFVPEKRAAAPQRPAAPTGPVVQESSGRTAPVRTYQDLLQDAHDEALFDHYFTGQLAYVDAASGERKDIGPPAIYGDADPSPDGRLLLVTRTVKPYSYLVTAGSFPEIVEVWDASGRVVKEVAKVPLREEIPIQGVQKGPRDIEWIDTAASSLIWTEALDEGDPKKKVPHRDRMLTWAAPFSDAPMEVLKLEHRASGMMWLQAPGYALVAEYDRDRRWARTWHYEIGAPTDRGPRLIWDRSVNDRYNDPGRPLTTRLPNGRSAVRVTPEGSIYLTGQGATPDGDRPFLDRMALGNFETSRLWRCEGDAFESIVDVLADDASSFLTSYETPNDPPNYYRRSLADNTRVAITDFKDPAPELRNARKELVKYKRPDGVDLSATLYLPPGYKEGTRLPLFVWAYPQEFNDAGTAGQVSGSPHRFTQVGGISHLFLLLAGYAILDGATMPVIGDPETMNDTFVEQIVAAAKAAIDKADEMGVADRTRVAVGGHSYGAFMTANLLAHCDLFRAGIARSGAYNRTLTPFGFQGERRTYWEAVETYTKLSPFTYAHKINEPLLMIHGVLDSNPGTFPIQSERLYHAVKGHGGTARLVMLPYESHGYQARESVYHTLAEMIDWLDRHVKSDSTGSR